MRSGSQDGHDPDKTTEKLQQIRAKVQQTTTKKVEMVMKQLERKYQWLASDTANPPANLLNVVRWYRKQPADVRAALDDDHLRE